MTNITSSVLNTSIPLTLLNEHEVAHIIRKSVHWLRRKRWQGGIDSIPYRKLGFSVRYVESDVLLWIEQHVLQTSTSENSHRTLEETSDKVVNRV